MKDKLILVKSKCNNPKNYADCNGCIFYGKNYCGTDKSSRIFCEKGYNYKLQEEEPIQTEWEWKKERYELLCGCQENKYEKEIITLHEWLQKNKPQNWQTCTTLNTSVGNIVKNKESCKKFTVSFFSNTGSTFLLRKECGIDNNRMSLIEDYEIDLGRKE